MSAGYKNGVCSIYVSDGLDTVEDVARLNCENNQFSCCGDDILAEGLVILYGLFIGGIME